MADEETDAVESPPSAWAVDINGTQVRLKDLPLSAVLRILEGNDTGATMIALMVQPLSDFPRAVKIVEECAKVAKVDDPAKWVEAKMDESWLEFTKLFVPVDDDLPGVIEDGVPLEAADPSTPT